MSRAELLVSELDLGAQRRVGSFAPGQRYSIFSTRVSSTTAPWIVSEPQSRLPHRLSIVWLTDLVGRSGLAARAENRAIALVRSDPCFEAILRRIDLA